MMDSPGPDWGVWASLGIFSAFAVVFWIIGIFMLEKRDA